MSATLLSELTKLGVSLAMYLQLQPSQRTHRLVRTPEVIKFAAPAAIYFVNNNLVYVILFYVNSTTFQASRRHAPTPLASRATTLVATRSLVPALNAASSSDPRLPPPIRIRSSATHPNAPSS